MEQARTQEGPAPMSRWRQTLGLAAVVGGVFIATLGLRATAQGRIPYPGIQWGDWEAYVPTDLWVLSLAIYGTLVLASLPLWGKLSDAYGRRPVWLIGLLLFMAGSAGIPTLGEPGHALRILAGFVQALGAGAIGIVGRALIGDMYPPSERAKWHGVLAAAIGLGLFGETTIRHLLFNLVVKPDPLDIRNFNAVWNTVIPWPLYVNLAIGGLVILAGWFGLPAPRPGARRPVDIRGAAALVGAAILLVMSFTLARSRLDGAFPWLSVPTIALLAGGAVMLGVLLVLARRAPDPIINLRALTNRAYGSAILLGCLVSVALANVQVYAWFFNRHGAIGSIGGSYPLPNPEQVAAALTFAAGAVVAGQVMWRTGRCKWPTRALLLIGMVGALLLARLTSQTTMVDLALAMAVMGLGLGGMSAVLITVVQNAMPYRSLGEVTAGLSFFGALAVALTGPFFHWLAQTSYAEVLTRPPPEGRAGVDVFAAPLDALSWVFLVTAALMAVGFVIALWLPETPVGRTTVPSSPRPTGLGRLRGPRRHAATSLPPPSVPTIAERRAREAPPRPPTDPAGDDARRTPPSTGGP